MNRIPSRRATLLAALLSCLLLPAVFLAQGTGPKALVICPPTDAAGCDRIATQLALAMNGGSPVFPGGVDKKYTELRTMPYSQLQSYAAVFVPSLANSPYALLREEAVRTRLQQVLRGRVAVWSGTPDRGTTTGASAGKLTLIQNLGRWAAGQHAVDGTAGLVVLQDFSDNRPDGTSPRYDWVQGISGVPIQPDLAPKTYAQVERNNANPAATPIVGSLAYDNMASFGLQLPQQATQVGAWGQTVQGKKTTRGQVVLATAARSPSACQVAGPAGGTFSFQGGKVVLGFPAGTLSEDWCISVSPTNATQNGYVANTAYSFSPSLDDLSPPVSLTISYVESDIPGGVGNESKLAVFELRGGTWVEVPGSVVDAAANTVTNPNIDHFGQYALFNSGTSDGGGGGGGGGKGGAPTANNDPYTTAEDTPLTVPAPGVLANDTDPQGDPITAVLVSGPAQGTLTLNANGSFTYTPTANFSGTATFTYKANDGRRDSNTATVTITITPVNDAPTAVNDALSTPEDTPLSVAAPGVLANDTDPDGNTLTAVLVSGPANGTLTLNANGSLNYTPNAGFSGTDQFTYRANDGTTDSNVATVTITVDDVNDPPTAVNDAYSTDEDVALVVAAPGVLANDTDPEGNPLTAVLVAGPASGTLALSANGSFTYTPAANASGPVTFTYKANDGTSDSNVATVTITVNAVNDAPAAVNDAYSTDEDTALNVAAPGVLGNDTDAEGNPLTAVLVAGPANGTLTLNANGSFTYTPTANFNGSDSFTYKANDGTSDSNVATVTITVNGQDEAPVATNDAYSTDEDTALNVAAPGVLANDTDADGGTLTAVLATGPTSGTLTLNANGSFTYTPNAGFSGTDQFTYKASDGALDSNVATVTITVATVNDAPTAVNDAYTTDEDVALVVAAPGVLGNDTDPENNPLSAVLVTGPANGTLTLNADGSFTYTPTANFNGSDSFTYKANDGTTDSNVATVSITINSVVEAPVAVNDAYSTDEDTPLSVAAPGVLANDTDADSGTLTAVLVSGTTSGTLTLNADGSFTYTPNAGFSGSDQFTYKANDGTGDSNVATVTITVAAVNDAPTAVNDAYTTDEDVALVVAAPGVLGNDTDPENNPLSAVLVTGPANGTLTLNADGSFTYTPTANFNGSDSFTYKANDGTTDSNVATVSITINSVVDPPLATIDAYSTNEDTPLTVAAPGVLANDSNPEGGTLTAVLVTTTTSGTLALSADGSFTYTPNANFFGTDQFTYKGNNGTSDGNTTTVTITVNPVNDLPVAAADAYTTDEDVVLNVAAPGVLANDTDVEGSALSAVLVTGPAHGTLTLNANGSFAYTPAANYFGADAFTYKANDGAGDSNTVTVSITVNPVNDAPVAGADAYNALGNVQAGIPATGVLGNDTDVDDPATNLSVQPATVSSTNGGTVVLSADGSFTYLSAAGYNGSDSFSYTVRDTAGATAVGTVVMTVTGTYWFVDASAPAGGDGRQNSRFQSLTPLNGAGGSGDPDDPADVILVHSGTYSSPIALEAGQRLLGQGISSSLTETVNGQTVTLLAAGSAPTLGSATGATIQLSTGNTVRGAAITSSAGAGIAGSTVGALILNEASVAATGGPALNIDGATSLAATLSSLSSTNSSAQGLRLNSVAAGSLTVSGATTITNPAGTGIDVQNSPITGTFAGTTVGKTASGIGVNLVNNTGATFGFSSLGITTGAGTGLVATSSGTVNVTTGSISATGGAAAQVGSTAGAMTFTSLASTNSSGAGLSLSSKSGSFTSGGTNIQNPTGIGIQVATSSATVSLANTTVNGSGGTGVSLTGNTGAITFADLDITPDANQRALLATDNTQTITATSGTISTPAGTGIPVEITRGSGTTPLAITFTDVSANGPLNGIKLTNTSGSFTVTGTGSTANSGGTIQNTTGDGVSLNGASNVTLRLMRLLPDASGIMATNLSGTNVIDRTVVDYLSTAPAGSYGLRMANTSTNATLTLDGTTFQNKLDGTTAVSVSAMGSSQITFNVQDGNAADAFESKFTNLFGSGVVVGAGDNAGSTAFVTVNVSNSKFLNAPSNGLNNLEMTAQQNSTLVPNITNNQFDKVGLPLAIVGVINFNTLHSGRIGSNAATGTVSGNSITNISSGAGPTFAYDPAGSNGYMGLRLAIENNVPGINHKVQILNNTFTGIARNGMYISARGQANNVNIKIDGNTIGTLAAPVGRANDRGIEIETQSQAAMKIDVTNNPSIVNSGSSGSNSALHFRSGVDNNTTGNIQATVTGNTIRNTNVGITTGRFRAQTLGVSSGLTSPAGSMCLDLQNNVLENAGKVFELIHESGGTFNRNAAGNTGTVSTTGSIGTVASCTRPTF